MDLLRKKFYWIKDLSYLLSIHTKNLTDYENVREILCEPFAMWPFGPASRRQISPNSRALIAKKHCRRLKNENFQEKLAAGTAFFKYLPPVLSPLGRALPLVFLA